MERNQIKAGCTYQTPSGALYYVHGSKGQTVVFSRVHKFDLKEETLSCFATRMHRQVHNDLASGHNDKDRIAQLEIAISAINEILHSYCTAIAEQMQDEPSHKSALKARLHFLALRDEYHLWRNVNDLKRQQ
jgi:hypothetical protein